MVFLQNVLFFIYQEKRSTIESDIQVLPMQILFASGLGKGLLNDQNRYKFKSIA